ncbi:DUF4124 domain-containing protein [Psychrobacter sp. I-STPA6b]|uniref:DUF4124 domain-containing protein n=1 Tax=Psychrobacter sp. I-STPA6b TaxID=2585718 RepID=UPI001D0C4799|nr:DUF4124 domain-containing protein [Psychrobacter sp. I-STPA6b]
MKMKTTLSNISHRIIALSIFALIGSSIFPAQAVTIYKSVGAHGEITYSQFPPKSGTNVTVLELREDGRTVDQGQMAGKTSMDEDTTQPTAAEQRNAELEAQLKDQKDKELAMRCQNLRNNLTNLNVGGRIYEMDENNERKYLDSREIEIRRERVQQAIQQYCSGQAT